MSGVAFYRFSIQALARVVFEFSFQKLHAQVVFTLCISRNLKFFCSGGGEGDVRVWEMRTREMVSHLKEHTHRVANVLLIGNET